VPVEERHVRAVKVSRGVSGQAKVVMERLAWQSRMGWSWGGLAMRGDAGHGSQGWDFARLRSAGNACRGKAVVGVIAGHGPVGRCRTWSGDAGQSRPVTGRHGYGGASAVLGAALRGIGRAWQGVAVTSGKGKDRLGFAGRGFFLVRRGMAV
jgi:hypothetical protein